MKTILRLLFKDQITHGDSIYPEERYVQEYEIMLPEIESDQKRKN